MPWTPTYKWLLFSLLAGLFAGQQASAQSYSWAWAQGINGTDDEEVADLVTDNGTGAVYAVGYTKSDGAISASLGTVIGNQDAFVVKYSAAGAVVWGFTPSGAGESQATGVALDAAGNIYITGWFKNTIDLHGLSTLGAGILISSGGEDWFIASYTPAGLLRWCTKLGGTSDERPVGIAASSNGAYAFGTVKGNITTPFGSIPASLPNGKHNLVLAKYSLLGVGQSLISGGSGQDELANSVVADDNGVYVACRTKDNDLLWYGPTGLLLGNASAIDEWDQRVTAFTTAGAHAWTATVSELSDAIEQAPSKLALGCGALYLTGLTHGPATFAGVGSVSSTTHDFFYLGRIERVTGQFVWVNKGTSTGPHHTTGGTDLAVGQNGLVHVVGKFKDDLTVGTRSITSANGKIQPFMASFRPTGSGASLEDLISSNDGSATAITADDQGNFILGGSYKANIACAALSLTGPNDLNGFLVKGSIPALAGVDISFWNAPATMCSNATPLDLSTLVTPYQTGNAASVVTSSNVFSPPSILGGVLGNYAQFNTANGYVTVDLGVTVPIGGIISLLWNANGSGATATTLVGTANPPISAQSSFTTSSNTDVYTSILLTTPARYIRITRSAASPAFDVDGIYYEYGNDLGGIWTGTGVTGSMFDPTGLSGPVSITYTIGTPPCTTSTSNSITIEAAPVGGSITSSVGGMLCPGNNSGTLTLSGYTGSITAWLMSTDGFASSTVIANTTATLAFSNLLVTTQYRARVGVTGCGIALSGIYTVQVGDNTAPVITTCPPAQTIYVGATCQVALPNLLPGAAGTDNCSASLTWSQFPIAGTLVNRGIHVVTITATDASGNSTTCNVTITAADNTAPVITGCPSNISMNADPGECSAIYNFAPPTATDNCGIALSAINVIAIADLDGNVVPALLAPNEYPVGVTTRTFTFTDASGNSSSCSFTITVVDTQFPTVVSCPGDITVPADAGACGANVTYTLPTFNDNCLFRVDLTEGLASGAFFPVGTTQVEYTATDSSNHSVNCAFNVIVQDLQNPVITGCPSNIIVQAPLAGTGATATWAPPTATDNCGVASITQTAGQAPGSFFLIGTHTITYTANGPNGGTSTCTFTVTVISNGAPTISCPPNQTLYSTPANCAQVFNYATPPVSDDLPLPVGQPVQIDGTGYSSGSAFPKGTTVQTWRVTDSNANSTTCTFNVQVIDTIRPTLQPCPTNITLNADAGACGAIHIYTPPSATDNCDGALTVIRIAGPASGSLFPIGTTIVRHRATDFSGRLRSCAFTVTVVDNIFPALANCPADINVAAATNACGAYVTFTSPTASDNCSAALTQTLGPVSGSLFPIGDTPVQFRATDPTGNFITCDFNVHVDDTTPPTFTYCPDTISVTSTVGLCGATVPYAAPVAADNCSSLMTLPAGQLSGDFFTVGHTSVTYTATDGTNAPAVCTFVVEVIDNQAPAINGLPGNIDMPNTAGVCEATITWTAPTASDNCSATLTSTHASGDVFPVGTTTVTYTATDGTNSTAQNFLITVTDNDDPTITCPANDTLSIASATCDVVMPVYAATATDNCAVDLIWQTAGPVAGDVLTAIGSPYSTTWFARDTIGNNSSCVQSIVVVDVDAPDVICPLYDSIEYYLDANCQLAFPDLRDSVTVTDCSAWTNTMWPPADTVFTQEMVVPMTMDIEDVFGNHVDNDHLIWIRDTIAPVIVCPSDTVVQADAATCLGTITPAPLAFGDNCSATSWTSSLPAGSYPAGIYPITLTATAGTHTATCSYAVAVRDTMIACTGSNTFTAALAGDCTANVTLPVQDTTTVDLCGPWTWGGSTHSDGAWAVNDTVPVTYTVIDAAGFPHSCAFEITVMGSSLPDFTYNDLDICSTDGTIAPQNAMPTVGVSYQCTTCASPINSDGSFDAATIGGGTHMIVCDAPCYNAATDTVYITVHDDPAPTLDYGIASICGDNGFVSPVAYSPLGGIFSSPLLGAALGAIGEIDLSLVATSATYTINYAIGGSCPQSISADLTIGLPPDAGDSDIMSICSNAAPIALFPLLGADADAGGTWTAPGGFAFGGTYDPAMHASGIYSYTVLGAAPCANETETITVTEVSAPNAGSNGTMTVCSNGSNQSLMAFLGGFPANGGTWSGPSPVVGFTYDPVTMVPGVYTYTVTGNPPCANATATVTVTETPAPVLTTGTYGPLCSNGAAIVLAGTPVGGTWTGTGVTGNSFDPAAGTQTLTYTVTAGGCTNSATTTITVNPAPVVTTGSYGPLCSNGAALVLAGTPVGGTWSGTGVTGNSFNPAAGSQTLTYSVTAGGCTNSATTTITVNPAPIGGLLSGSGTVCPGNNSGTLTLSGHSGTILQWSKQVNGGGWVPFANNAATYVYSNLLAGTYEYRVAMSTATCGPVQSTIATVTVSDNTAPAISCPSNITATAAPGACSALVTYSATATDNCAANPNISYSPLSGSAFTIGSHTVTATAIDGNGNQSSCTFNVTVNATQVDLAYPVTSICQNAVAILPSIVSPPINNGGVFSDATQSNPQTVDPVTGAFDPSNAAPGLHVIGYVFAGACTSHDWFTINVVPDITTGTPQPVSICSGSSIILEDLLAGETAGGTWTNSANQVVSGSVAPTSTETYTYAVDGTAPCADATADVTVTVTTSTSNSTTTSACDSYTWAVNGTSYNASGIYTNVVGCHTETLDLTITPSTSNSTTASACDSYVWAVNGTSYNASGIYTSVVGCHTETLDLTITPSTSNSTTASACDSYVWAVNGTSYNASGIYTSVVGCHTETLDLTITPSTSNSTTASACDSYTWAVNGTSYNASGTYTSVVGCHTETLNLTITPSTSNSTTASACDSYTWAVNGTIYTASGVYTNVVGCHTETLNLTITPSTSNSTTASACDSYVWAVNGTSYNASGIYTNVVGCHTETLNLTITPSTSNSTTASACDSYTWAVNGTSYNASGIYTNVVGCHTETLDLTITPSTSNATTASACDSYVWAVNGTSYNASGIYTNVVGCHTETLDLTITPSTSNSTTASACDSYTWAVNGTTYNASGIYTNVVGCHTETLNLTITPSTSNSTTASACDSYVWAVNGTSYNASGIYTNVVGCHTETLDLTITPSTSNSTTASACDSYTWAVNGTSYNASGIYTNVVGCHTETLDLTITPSTSNATTASACDSYVWAVNGTSYNASGIYTNVVGCHTETLDLTITPSTSNSTTASACDSYTWAVNGTTYNASGIYTNVVGCHIETLDLTITPSTSNATTASACDSYVWAANGSTYNASGIYTNVVGCHTETLDLTITPSTSNATTASACDSYVWAANGSTYNASGIYTNVVGCHTETLDLTITPSTSNSTTASACDSYVWAVNGTSYNASGIYTSVVGCHTETLDLTITPSTSNATTASACDSYTWAVNGTTYNASGNYTNVVGCHTETLDLTITPSTSNSTTASACDSYTWAVNGTIYTASGVYTNVVGCHTETLNLTITPSTSNSTTASACDSYVWAVNGTSYNASGIYTNVVGCHTETLNLTITPSTSNSTTASACDSYTWAVNGTSYNTSGIYTSVIGCHTETLDLTITPSTSNSTTASACDSYVWAVNGTTYNAGGNYTHVVGCHTETLDLTITPSTSNNTTASACDNYVWAVNGTSYNASGIYTNVVGCHTETLNLTITPSTSNSTTASACDSYVWAVNGTSYNASGIYTNVVGCHTETLNLTITPSTSNSTTASACDSYVWAVNGTSYNASGIYTNVVGCHTETLDLTITPSTSNSTTASACDSYVWAVNGTSYNASGIYTNVVGCHTETLNLTITPSTSNSTTASACDSYTWAVNGTSYNTSGIYTSVVGCHTETLNLTITPSTSNATTASACDSYTWAVNGTTYNASGNYTNVVGCHTETLDLTITPSTSNSTTASACDSYVWAVNGTSYNASGIYTNVVGCHTETLDLTITPSTSNSTTASACDSYVWAVNGTSYNASGNYTHVVGCHTETLDLTVTTPGTACDDLNAATGNDLWDATCTCVGQLIDCEGTAGGAALIGTPCDDLDAATGNDTWGVNCICAGQLIDCDGVVGGSAFAGAPCDDNNPATGNDVYDATCGCAGLLIDCDGVVGGAAFAGSPCDDGNPATGNDVYDATCGCAGQLIDCDGVVGGAAFAGSPCDDGNPATGNDVYDATCGCAGLLIDCDGVIGGSAFAGAPCDDNNAATGNDVYDASCGCAGQLIDCDGVVGGAAFAGSPCDDNNPATGNDVYDASCGCAGQLIDCDGVVGGAAFAGSPCDDGNAATGNDVYDASCGCAGLLIDCDGVIGGSAFAGAPCDDNNPATGNDVYDASCGCAGQLIDCDGVVGGAAFAGSPCDDGNAATGNDVYDATCGCAGQLIDCDGVVGGAAFAGSPCDDGNAATGNDVYDASCGCAGQLIDCDGVVGGAAFAGSPCDDGNAATGNDVYDATCGCAGQLIDCDGVVGGAAFAGSPCDDGNPATGNDVYDASCGCAGLLIDCDGVVGGSAFAGAPCDDNNPATGNDVYDASCGCAGLLIDCDGVVGGSAFAGAPCDDNNAATGNDVYDATCGCAGLLIDCDGVIGGSAFAGAPCDDNNAATGNDVYDATCGCAGLLIDCDGVVGGAAFAGSPCDDNNAATGNDVYDATCGCAGQIIDCLNVPGGTNLPGTPCDDLDAATGNDTWGVSCICAGQLIDCDGVVGGIAFAGAPCDDNNPATGNDVYDASCGCAGLLIDCDGVIGGSAFAGAPCDDNNAATGNDVYDATCGCAGLLIDCDGVVGGSAFAGAPCNDNNPATGNDVYDATCGCAGLLIDCDGVVGGSAFAGAPCNDNNPATGNDVYDASCGCAGLLIDCDGVVGGSAFAGAPCNDNNPATGNDVYDATCGCAGLLIDCDGVVGGSAFAGAPCDDNNAATGNDVYDASCGCAGQILDCLNVPGGTNLPGTPCDDLDAATGNDTWGANCICAGLLIDCDGVVGGSAFAGAPCNDNNPATGNDVYDATCGCAGQLIDCDGVVGGSAFAGAPCDDNNAATGNDVYDASCGCAGLLIDCLNVPGGANLPGTPCDDLDAATGNDTWGVNCICAGLLIDCDGVVGGSAFAGAPCNDNNPATGNDVYDASCGCAGLLIDCDGVIGGSAFAGAPCNDNNPATGNDVYDASCGCAGLLIDCDGVIGGSAFAGAPCDDNNPATGNDVYDASCGCAGQIIDCLNVPGGTNLPGAPCDDLDAATGNDTWGVNCICAGLLIDCDGVVGGSAFAGTPCDDNNAATGNDVYDATCGCAGQIIDCLGVPGGAAVVGSTCDDGNPNTSNDIYGANCICAGTPVNPCDAPVITAFTATSPLCQGESALLETSVTGTAPFILDWSGPGMSQSGSTANLTAPNAQPGTYQVIVTNACGDDTTTVIVVVNPLPDASFLYSDAIYCQNSFDPSPTISATGGTFAPPNSSLIIDVAYGTIDLDASAPGTYIITYTLEANGCTALHTEQVTIAAPPVADWTSPGSLCDGIGAVDLTNYLDAGTTPGGTWSGSGITGNFFNPAGLAGLIEITYTPTVGDCSANGVQYITITPAPVALAGPDAEVCGLQHQMSATLQTAVGYWTPLNGGIVTLSTDPATTVTVTGAGAYNFLWTVGDGQCFDNDTVLVTFFDPATLPTVDAGPDQELNVVDHTFLNGSTSGTQWSWSLSYGGGNISDIDDLGTEVYLLGVGANSFVLSASNGPCPSTMDTVVIIVNDLSIPTGFSPNGDGTNDVLVIPGIEEYRENSLIVFDRWGRKVYEQEQYANDWEGKALPDDTYFMVLNIAEGRTYNGYLIIKR